MKRNEVCGMSEGKQSVRNKGSRTGLEKYVCVCVFVWSKSVEQGFISLQIKQWGGGRNNSRKGKERVRDSRNLKNNESGEKANAFGNKEAIGDL